MRNAGLEEAQAGIKTSRRTINNLRYTNDTILKAESEEELKSLFHFHREVFSSSSPYAKRVVSSASLRLLIFLPPILIPASPFSSPAFRMMYSAFKLNKQGDNMQP